MHGGKKESPQLHSLALTKVDSMKSAATSYSSAPEPDLAKTLPQRFPWEPGAPMGHTPPAVSLTKGVSARQAQTEAGLPLVK